MDENDERHGTANGYNNQKCRCDRCKAGWAVYTRGVKERRKAAAKDPQDPRHGTPAFYGNHGCRCDKCRAAWAADIAEDNRNRKKAA
jgi:hypothetical protein